MIGFIEHFFTITINYSVITNLDSPLGHAPFSSLYSQLHLASEFASFITTLHRPDGKQSTVDEVCLPRRCLAIDSLLLSRAEAKNVYQTVA
jgi:hypothetical protein